MRLLDVGWMLSRPCFHNYLNLLVFPVMSDVFAFLFGDACFSPKGADRQWPALSQTPPLL